jgi:hypothetical protein
MYGCCLGRVVALEESGKRAPAHSVRSLVATNLDRNGQSGPRDVSGGHSSCSMHTDQDALLPTSHVLDVQAGRNCTPWRPLLSPARQNVPAR